MAAAQAAIASSEQPDQIDKTPPVPPAPVDCNVTLPGGYVVIQEDDVYTEAVVRELDGDDEEAIARVSGNFSKLLEVTLQRGVVSVGPHEATKKLLDGLLMGDRDALLVAIRRVTFGDEVEFTKLACPSCGAEQEPKVRLSTDIPVRTLDDPFSGSTFELTLASEKSVAVSLPTGDTQRALGALAERTEAAMNSELLAKCVKSIDGVPVMSKDQVRRGLKVLERREILKEIDERNPGPRLGEVSQPCAECGEQIPLALSLAALFLG
jgi:hypothetical protein